MRVGRAGAQIDERSRAEAHARKHRAASGGADGWDEWGGGADSKAARKRAVAAAPPQQHTEMPQWEMPASNWSRDALELELAARADELVSLSPRSHEQYQRGSYGAASSTAHQ